MVIKDCVAVAGVSMTIGSRMLDGYIPDTDATVVNRILNQGQNTNTTLPHRRFWMRKGKRK